MSDRWAGWRLTAPPALFNGLGVGLASWQLVMCGCSTVVDMDMDSSVIGQVSSSRSLPYST